MFNGQITRDMKDAVPALGNNSAYGIESYASTPNHSQRAVIRRTKRPAVEVVVGLRGRSAQRVTGKRSKNGCGVTRGSAPYFNSKKLHLSRIHKLRHGGTSETLRGLTKAQRVHSRDITQEHETKCTDEHRNTIHGITCTKFATHGIYACHKRT